MWVCITKLRLDWKINDSAQVTEIVCGFSTQFWGSDDNTEKKKIIHLVNLANMKDENFLGSKLNNIV